MMKTWLLLSIPLVSAQLKHLDIDVGAPLNDDDRALAALLPKPNLTLAQLQLLLEEGEAKANFTKKGNKNIQAALKFHWPNGEVPYTISATFTAAERAVIVAGLDYITEKTGNCIKYVARTTESDYMNIFTGDSGCYANDRYYKGYGEHKVNLQQNGCVYQSVVLHELLHILGVAHEQMRPDRDDFVTMHWSNIKGIYASNMWKDAWDTTADSALLPVCSDSGLSGTQTRDFTNCYSGSRTTAYGYAYDFTSIMHYSLKSFAVDSSQNAMTPKDSSITSAGNSEMSALDIKKLTAAYSCNTAEVNKCGGYFKGVSGTIESGDNDSCNWLLEVETGYAIKLTTNSFQATCPSKLEIRNGNTISAALISSFCGSDVPTVMVSPDSSLYISWSRVGTGQSFSISWERVTITCCNTVKLASTGLSGTQLSSFMKVYTYTAGDDVNGRPIYRNGAYWIASTGSSWIVSSTTYGQPGASNGFMFGSGASTCPTAAGSWRYVNQETGQITDDSELAATCDVACSSTPPAAPTGAVQTWSGATTVNTVVSYKCSDTETKYATCSSSGTWDPTTIASCTAATTAAPTAAPTTAAPTAAPTTGGGTFPINCKNAVKGRVRSVTPNMCRVVKSHNSYDGVTKYKRGNKGIWKFRHTSCEMKVQCEGFKTNADADCKGDKVIIAQGKTTSKFCQENSPDGTTYPASTSTKFKFRTNKKGVSTGFKCYFSCV